MSRNVASPGFKDWNNYSTPATSRKILRENHKIAAKLEKISDGVARRSSGYNRTKPLHEGPLQKRNREMALARRARPVLQQPDMTF